MTVTFLTLCYLITYLSNQCHAQQQQQLSFSSLQPYFIKSMDSINVKENTPVDEIIYTLEARIDSSRFVGPPQQLAAAGIIYGIEGTDLFNVNKTSGQVRVAHQVDREQTGDSITFQVTATPYFMNRPGTPAQLTITVYILDENDNPPKIERVRVAGRGQEYDSIALARLTNSYTPNGRFIFPTSLASSSLVPNRGVPLIRFNLSENAPIDSVIVDLIEAVDIDKVSSSPLNAVCLDCEPEFELRAKTASLLNDRLEWSIVLVRQLVHVPRNNVRQLNVVISDGKFNTSIIFEVTIDDVQNKPPQFLGSTTCIVKENVPIDKTIMTLQAVDGDALAIDDNSAILQSNQLHRSVGGRQIIYDFVDSNGQSSSHLGDFKLHPLTGQLQIANRLDREAYLSMNSVLSLQIRARELNLDTETIAPTDDLYDSILSKLIAFVDQSEDATSVAEVTVIIVDVNDNSPHWLNGSEIAALNINQSPFWHNSLPNDRDTGRNYQVRVRENSPPGSVLTLKNEIFVYDLDSGDNAQFNISIEDPFNLFDIEPKQVSGFASINLKLANFRTNANGIKTVPKLLDYENINERSYIIQLHAKETKTSEMFRSKAQIQITVLDVNDNAPEFKELAYMANIREDAPAGKIIKLVQATDKDEVSKQITYALHGKSAYLFDINPQSGLITVAKCEQQLAQPSNSRQSPRWTQQQVLRPCIDFELQRSHHLMVEASDGELTSRVPLTIFIDDASDNPPVFTLPIMDVVIEEGAERLDPPIKVEAVDADQTSVLSYSIVEGNFEGLFVINNSTGELQLTRPIRIAHDDLSSPTKPLQSSPDPMYQQTYGQQHLNKMTLIVQATDGEHTTNCTIRIDILDANDNAPKFMRQFYEKEITESYYPGQSILTVRAFDLDRGNNARVSYRIERGSYNQFEINQTSGEITVDRNAKPFDARKKDNYSLEVVAHDHGLISKSSSVIVNIRVLSTNRRAPEFFPQIQRANVSEKTLNNSIIHRMTVIDTLQPQQQPDISSDPAMMIFEPGPIEALDKNGQPVTDIDRLETMFSVSTNTGDVAVNSALDHDFAAYVNLTIFASYRSFPSGSPVQPMVNSSIDFMLLDRQAIPQVEEYNPRSTGYLVINVADENNNPPVFASPWTPFSPELSFQIQEELPAGSILTQLVASDSDSKISHFRIEPPSEYFELASPQSGLIVTKKPIDYDLLMRQTFLTPSSHRTNGQQQSAQMVMPPQSNNILQFNVYVYDSGVPQLSAKAIVSVEVMPVNDWDCKFEQTTYEAHVKENSQPDIIVAQVRANDLDYGEQHSQLSYQIIGEHRDLFNIDQRTGLITVSNKGSMNLDREKLGQAGVLTISVVGRDEQVVASTQDGISKPRIAQQRSVFNGTGRSCFTTVKIHVDDTNDNPPLFSQKFYEITAYDTDRIDGPLIKLIVRDDDMASNNSSSKFVNSFRIVSGNLNESFNISSQGVLYLTKPLTEASFERHQSVDMRVQVKQHSMVSPIGQGMPTLFTDECVVRINLVKINRHAPEWKLDSLKSIVVEENAKPGTIVTQLRCTDKDIQEKVEAPEDNQSMFDVSSTISKAHNSQANNRAGQIRYWIKEKGNNVFETSEFKLDPVTGTLVTRVPLDRESQEFYELIVSCEDNGKPQSLESITPLYITVLDMDDNKPEFIVPKNQEPRRSSDETSSSYQLVEGQVIEHRQTKADEKLPIINFNVEEHQSKGLQIGELKAIDGDLKSQYPINYCIIDGNEFQEFVLDHVTGILYTNQTLDRERQSTYDLVIKAINDGSSCEDHISAPNISSTVSAKSESRLMSSPDMSLVKARIEVLDINDNAPVFKRSVYRAGVHHRSLMNTLVTQLPALDPDSGANGTLNYKINEILMYKTSSIVSHHSESRGRYDVSNEREFISKPIKLMQSPFRIDQQGNIYTQQLLTQYQLMSMFVLQIEASEQYDPWRTAYTKLEIYTYETNSQLKIRINLHPSLVETFRYEIETLMSNATKFTAIINRARSYNGIESVIGKNSISKNLQSSKIATHVPVLDLASNQASASAFDQNEPRYSNIHLIFVDNYRIVNPNAVMEKFDLTSAQLFTAQSLTQQFKSNGNDPRTRHLSDLISADRSNELSSLIDRIALASTQAAEHHNSPSTIIGIDWLESPSVLFVALASVLSIVGFIFCLAGCCCTSRVKDHIIKVAMDKLVKQQELQAKISERVLAATNQSYANLNGGTNNNGLKNATNAQQLDYMMQQGGMMSSFDATRGCVNNNYENLGILQRAMDAGEFVDTNYLTLNGHMNMGAHYFDASELGQPMEQYNIDANGNKHTNGSTVSLSMADDEDFGENYVSHKVFDMPTENGESSSNPTKEQKLYTNGVNGVVSSQSRLRQQVPQSNGK